MSHTIMKISTFGNLNSEKLHTIKYVRIKGFWFFNLFLIITPNTYRLPNTIKEFKITNYYRILCVHHG